MKIELPTFRFFIGIIFLNAVNLAYAVTDANQTYEENRCKKNVKLKRLTAKYTLAQDKEFERLLQLASQFFELHVTQETRIDDDFSGTSSAARFRDESDRDDQLNLKIELIN